MTPPTAEKSDQTLIDWDLAARAAAAVVRPGPQVSRDEASEAVSQLRHLALAAQPHVARITGLDAPAGGQVLVVDRPGWVRANITAFRVLLEPVVAESLVRREKTPGALATAVGSKVTGAELGSLLAFLSSKVLGQYDVFAASEGLVNADSAHTAHGAPQEPGRLLLVAPNVVSAEREMDIDPADFRLWVCLHEETHRVQFTATPWLGDHVLTEVRALVGDLLGEPGAALDRLGEALRRLPDLLRGGRDGDTGASTTLLDLVQTPEQRERLARLTAVMSLLEGHADVVMDEVGPDVVPTVAQIRKKFDERRKGRGVVDQLLRRLLGLEAKMRQYRDGAVFVRRVVDEVGMEGFNAVWSQPQSLPTPQEIADPGGWVRRVHG